MNPDLISPNEPDHSKIPTIGPDSIELSNDAITTEVSTYKSPKLSFKEEESQAKILSSNFRSPSTIALLILALLSIIFVSAMFAFLQNKQDTGGLQTTASKIPVQKISLPLLSSQKSTLLDQTKKDTLLVNGDIYSQGNIRLYKGDYHIDIQADNLTGNQTFVLPDASGTICLNSNNCQLASLAQLNKLAAQLNTLQGQSAGVVNLQAGTGITIAGNKINNAGLRSLNGLTGGITLQGTANQIAVSVSGSTITLTTPQNIDLLATPTFQSINLSATGTQGGNQICDSSNNCGYASSVGSGTGDVNQGGNSFGATFAVGANDNFGFNIKTNNTVVASFTNTGLALFKPAVNSVSAFQIQDNSGNSVLAADTAGGQLVLGTANNVTGKIKFMSAAGAGSVSLAVANPAASNFNLVLPAENGTLCSTAGSAACLSVYAASSGSANYIQNQNAADQAADFRISGSGRANTSITTPLLDTPSAAALNIGTSNATAINLNQSTVIATGKSFSAFGSGLFRDNANSATAFQVQNSASNSVLTVDTTNALLILGKGSTLAGKLVLNNSSNNFNGTLQTAALGQNTTYTLPDPGAVSANICLSTGNCAAAGAAGGDLTGNYPNPTIAKLQGTTVTTASLNAGDIFLYNGAAWVNQAVSGDIVFNGSGVASIQANSVALGTDTVGNYVDSLGSLTGLTTSGNSGEGSTPTLSVIYGATANSAVQGNVAITCPSGSGNLSGGGNSITLGSGGSCNNITISNSPTFSGTLAVQGATITVGAAAQQGSLILNDGSSNTGTLQLAALGQNTVYTLPDPGAGSTSICLTTGNCAGLGGGITGSGTSGKIAKFTAGGAIGDSTLSESGSTLTASGNIIIQGSNALALGTSSSIDGSIKFYNSLGAHTVTLQAPAADPLADLTFKLPSSYGGNGDCLLSNGIGGLSFSACTGGAGGGVTNLDSQTGVVTLANSSGSGGTVTIDDASTAQKGIVRFNNTNFSVASGIANTIQDIATTSSPTFTAINTNTITPSGAFTLGATGQSFTLQGSSASKLTATGGGFTTTIGFTGVATASQTFNFDRTAAAGTYTICTTAVVCAGYAASSGSGNYIQNQNSADQSADFRISGTGRANTSIQTPLLDTAAAAALNIGTNNATAVNLNQNTNVASGKIFSVLGTSLFKNNADSATSFQIQNAGGRNVFTADTSSAQIILGDGTHLNGKLVFKNSTNNFSAIVQSAVIAQDTTYNLPDGGGASVDFCLSSGNCVAAGTAGGDLTGSYPNPTIAKLQGANLNTSSLTAGDLMLYDGSQWLNQALSGDASVNGSGSVTISANAVALGTDTTGNYVATLGSLTGLSTTGNSGEGSSPTLSVLYGAIANTAVQGNVTLTCPGGTGNVGGGGNTITLGSGGSCSNITFSNSPTFSGTLTVQGATVTVGTAAQQGSLVLNDGSANTGTLKTAALGQDTIYSLPDPGAGSTTICISTGNCAGAGGGITGSGTDGKLTKFAGGGTQVVDSTLSESGSTLTASGNIVIQGGNSLTLGTSNSLDGSIKFYNSSGTHTVTLQAPAADPLSNLTFKLPSADGSAGDCLLTDSFGGLYFNACPGGGGGSVTSIDLLSGALTIANSTGSVSTITIDDASTAQKGIVRFNNTNFSVASGIANTIQDIATTSSPTFASINTNTITPSGAFSLGVTGQSFTLQGSSASTVTATGGGFTTTVGFAGVATASQTFNFDRTAAAGTYTICTTATVCAGYGAASGSGNYIQNQSASDQSADFRISGTGRANTSVQTPLLDTATGVALNIGTTNATSINLNQSVSIAANKSLSYAAGSGTFDQSASSGTFSTGSGNVSINGNATVANNKSFTANGAAVFQDATNGTSAFVIQKATASDILFTADTSNNRVIIGNATASAGSDTTALVLDSAATANAPSGINGAMYYDTTLNKFECYQNGIWVDCITNTGAGGPTLQSAYNNSTGGTTPEIKLDSTRGALDIQDANSTIGGNLLNIRASNGSGLGQILFGVGNTGAITAQNSSNSTAAFQIQDAAGTSLLNVDTSTALSVLANPSAEQALAGNWIAKGGATVTQDSTQKWIGNNSIKVITTASNVDGVQQNITLTDGPAVTYGLTFMAKLDGASAAFNTIIARYNNGTADTACLAGGGVVSTGWQRYTCTFNSPNSHSGTPYLYIGQSDNTAHTFYIDAIQLIQNSTLSPYTDGVISLNGVISSPAIFQNQSDSTNAFQIQNSTGTSNALIVDTVNSRVGIAGRPSILSTSGLEVTGTTYSSTGFVIGTSTSAGNITKFFTVGTGGVTASHPVVLNTDSGNPRVMETTVARDQHVIGVAGTTAAATGTAWVTIYGAAQVNADAHVFGSAGGAIAPGDRLVVSASGTVYKDNSATSGIVGISQGTLALNGTSSTLNIWVMPQTGNDNARFQNTVDNGTSFAIQNAAGTSLLNSDTTNSRISIGSTGTNTGQLYVSGLVNSTAVSSTAVNAGDLRIQGKFGYELDGSTNSFFIYDFTNPASPTLVNTVNTNTTGSCVWPSAIVIGGKYAYITCQTNDKLGIYDISNPKSVTSVSTTSTGNADEQGLFLSGRYLYHATGSAGTLQVWDVANPALPVLKGTKTFAANTRTYSVFVQGRYAYVASRDSVTAANSKFYIVDVVDPTNPTQVGSFTTADTPISGFETGYQYVYVQGIYAYVTIAGSTDAVKVLNISDPTNPTLVSTISGAGAGPTSVVVRGKYLYIGFYNSTRIVIYDISNPAAPASVNTVGTTNGVISMQIQGRYAYTTNAGNTMRVYDLGGAYIQQLEAGGIETSVLQVNNSANILGDANIAGGLSIGQSLQLNGNLGASGQAMFQNAANSTSAFQIQNAAGGSIFNADTTNGGAITVLGQNSGEVGSWTTQASNLNTALQDSSAVYANGYIYILGGANGTPTAQTTTQYAKVNADGSLAAFTAGPSLPAARVNGTAVYLNGYIYYISGGSSNGSIYYSRVNPDGTLNAWQTNPLVYPVSNNGTRTGLTSFTYNGYIYTWSGSNIQEYTFVKPNTDGTLSNWTYVQNFANTNNRSFTGLAVANGFVYWVGGQNNTGTPTTSVTFSTINSDGTLSTPTSTTALPEARSTYGGRVEVVNGYLYVMGGVNASGTLRSTVYYAKLNSNGTVGNWNTAVNNLPVATGISDNETMSANGYLYVIGGNLNASNAVSATTYYASASRLSVGGALDLVGSTANSGSIASGGGSLTSGNTNVLGSLNVAGESSFSGGASFAGLLSAGAGINVQGSANATALSTTTLSAPSGSVTVATAGSAGGATWSYKITAVDGNGNESTTSATGSIGTGNANLDTSNFNKITWNTVRGASYYNIYRTAVGTSPATTGLIATVAAGPNATQTAFDQGAQGATGSTPVTTTKSGSLSVAGAIQGQASFVGDILSSQLTPVGGVSVNTNTTGATSYTYAVTAVDVQNNETSATSVTYGSGNANIATSNNVIVWSPVPGAAKYKIYRTASAGLPATTGLIGTNTISNNNTNIGPQTFIDTGIAGDGSIAPSTNTTGVAVFNGYSTTSKSAVNNSTAFQIQNAAGSSLFTADTSRSSITILGNNSPETGTGSGNWTTAANTFTGIRSGEAAVTANGYIYVLGGNTSTTSVQYAKLNADGSPGTWAATTALPSARANIAAVFYNGYIWIFGGTSDTNVYSAKVNTDGTLGSWNQTTSLTAATSLDRIAAVTANGYVYIIGGRTTSGTVVSSQTQWAKLNSDGTITSWTQGSGGQLLPAAREGGSAVIANGYVYYVGGLNVNPQNNVYIAQVNADGSLGNWSTSGNPLPDSNAPGAGRAYHGLVQLNGYLYVIGGRLNGSGTGTNTIEYSQITAAGTNSSWSTSGQTLPATRYITRAVTENGYIYLLGGVDNVGPTDQNTTYYTSTQRLKVGGSLDLVGLSGINLADSGATGGNLTAGNGYFVGRLQVKDQATFDAGLSVEGETVARGGLTIVSTGTGNIPLQINNTTTGINLLQVKDLNTNFGSAVTGGAFIGRNSYFGEEFNNYRGTAATADCIQGRGDFGDPGTAACTTGTGELTLDVTTTGGGTNSVSSVADTVNGIESIGATSAIGGTSVAEEYLGSATINDAQRNWQLGNLPVMTFKFKPSVAAAGQSFYLGLTDQDTPAISTATANGVWFSNCSTAAATPTCDGTLRGVVANGAGTVTTVSCGAVSTTKYTYGRIEVRSATDIHFFVDLDVSDGIVETECGSGITTNIPTGTTAMTLFAKAADGNSAAETTTLLVDYMRAWQDDNLPPNDPDQKAPATSPDGQPVETAAPLSPDSADPTVLGSFFNFNAATSEDVVFNHNVYVHGTLYADKIKANEIDGLSIFTDQITSLQQQIAANLAAQQTAGNPNDQKSGGAATTPVMPAAKYSINLSAGGLSVGGDAEFHGNAMFYKLVTFVEKSVFNNDIRFNGHITTGGGVPSATLESGAGLTTAPNTDPTAAVAQAALDGNDNSGQINVKVGSSPAIGKLLTVNFSRAYEKAPQVYLTAQSGDSAGVRYYVQSTNSGFTIFILDTPAAGTNLSYNYLVIQ